MDLFSALNRDDSSEPERSRPRSGSRRPPRARSQASDSAVPPDDRPAPPPAPSPAASADPPPLTVSALNEQVRRALQDGLPGRLRVRGEISNLSRRGHWYFSLKDAGGVVSCVAWRSTAGRFTVDPAEGDELIATGRIDHWAPGGRTQFYVDRLESAGRGTLQQQFERLCRELRGLGWFEDASKQALPTLPRRIAVITSATGAAIRDVLATAAARLPAVGIVLYDVRVQGDAAAGEVAAAVERAGAEARDRGVDAIVVTRGGGSIEDLWAFNERVVAEAIRACPIPIVAAIGHESDTTVAELVADRRASTPTQAAMLLVPDRTELNQQVDHLSGRLAAALRQAIDARRRRVDALADRPALRDPRHLLLGARTRLSDAVRRLPAATRQRHAAAAMRLERLAGRWREARPSARQAARRERLAVLEATFTRALVGQAEASRRRLDDAAARLGRAMRERLDRSGHRLARADRGVALLDPSSVLGRGYTYTMRASDERLVRGPDDVAVGTELRTIAADGTIHSRVIDTEE
ncbi:MAG: exodeoxyribonuclease VII large subunit [Phycisphaerales bacterium]